MERLYFVAEKSPYAVTEDGVSHGFVLANRKNDITPSHTNGCIIDVHVATQADVDKYGQGRSRGQIFNSLRNANIILRGF